MFWVIYLFVLGSVLTSFYTLVGCRLPLGKSIISPRSHCDYCNHNLKWYELIPIVSYIFQRGRCRNCQKKLSLIYPILEFSGGFLFSLAYIYKGLSFEFLILLLLISLALIIIVSDFKYMVILDSPLIVVSIMIVILKFVYFDLYHVIHGIVCGVIMFLFLLLVRALGNRIFKRDSLGGGDIKLSFVFGLVLGIKYSFVALVIGCFLAFPYAFYSMNKKMDSEIPFGPFLILGLLITFWFMDYFNQVLMLI